MESILFALCLEVALLQMRILEGSTKIRSLRWKQNENWNKLEAEWTVIKDVLKRMLIEIVETGSWTTLQQTAQTIAHQSAKLLEHQSRYEDLKKSRENVTRELNTKRRQWSEKIKSADETIAILRDKKQDDLLNASMRLCYAEKWLLARSESLDLKLQAPRPILPRVDHENRVHRELLKLIELQIKEREEISEFWRMRYADDIAAINKVIAEKHEQWKTVCSRRAELQKQYDDHDAEIRSWLNVKRERAERLAEEERQRRAATYLQAWWRGVMVRRCIGAFKSLRTMKKPSAKGKKK